ncbi:MAG: 1-acyl-sn-glycerol-3-phosphate acyltransferase [Betaproteobacteria bacterium]|nr:MAG: 1-acyl-sn-glycerol-3-phosphate acyltransferase [Betaproteobacteria bacterium]TDI80341.1 MAG: 1-acyl-sn-glycerol-3-phosphate acyltransferase [Betaproteobacteria bacterium]
MSNTTTSKLTQTYRVIRLLLHIISGLVQSAFYPHVSPPVQKRMAKKWSADLLAILCIRLRFSGALPVAKNQPVMLVANHVSWLDIYSLITVCPARFVAKSEIRDWPLFGWLSRNVGTLFIERAKRRDITRINRDIGNALTLGDWVAIFPEGTTGDGSILQHFHASLLQSAVAVEALLHPVAIRYYDASGEVSKAAVYVSVSLLGSLRRILQQPWINVELIFPDPVNSNGKNRRELARITEQAIANALSLPIPHKVPGKSSYPPIE